MRSIASIREDLEKKGVTLIWSDDGDDDEYNEVSYGFKTPRFILKKQAELLAEFKKKYPKPPVYKYPMTNQEHKAYYAYHDQMNAFQNGSLCAASICSNNYCCAYDDVGSFYSKTPKYQSLMKEWLELVQAKNTKIKFLNAGVPNQKTYEWVHTALKGAGFTEIAVTPTRHGGQKYTVSIYIWVRKPTAEGKALLKEIKDDK